MKPQFPTVVLYCLSLCASLCEDFTFNVVHRLDQTNISTGAYGSYRYWLIEERLPQAVTMDSIGDTIQVNVIFADSQRLRIIDTNAAVDVRGGETMTWAILGQTGGGYPGWFQTVYFEFLEVSGDLAVNPIYHVTSGAAGDTILRHDYGNTHDFHNEPSRLTSSSFEFGGYSFRFRFDDGFDAGPGPFVVDRFRTQITLDDIVIAPPVATNAPPTLTCPGATVVECGTEAELTAQVSDPEGDAMALVWTLNGTAIETNLVPASSPGTVTNIFISGSFPLGTNILGIGVTDGTNVTSCTTGVTVVDTTPPVISYVAAYPSVLWPPDHRMVRVALRASVSDVCGAATWSIIGVQCNEPANARGDGNTSEDWSIAGEDTVFLRAERSGRDDSRIYFVEVQATDASGNQSEMQTVTVTVPKSLGKGK
jgi:hypothetical protein